MRCTIVIETEVLGRYSINNVMDKSSASFKKGFVLVLCYYEMTKYCISNQVVFVDLQFSTVIKRI